MIVTYCCKTDGKLIFSEEFYTAGSSATLNGGGGHEPTILFRHETYSVDTVMHT